MKKWISVALAIVILFGGAGAMQVQGAETPGWIDKTRVDQGAIRINYDVKDEHQNQTVDRQRRGEIHLHANPWA
ncbi:hypothetical protein HMSSN139_27350 [Paenibacillus sp. HMSSN-139]|nr:hypothetical protein HMSSN139_27350 [Paenibacillus sp. HMSSN-139]